MFKRARRISKLTLSTFILLLVIAFGSATLTTHHHISLAEEIVYQPAAQAVEVEAASTEAENHKPAVELSPYSLGQAHHRDLSVQVEVSNTGSNASRNVRLEIPMLSEIDSPYQSILKEDFSHEPTEVNNGTMGNRSGVFNIDSLAPGSSKTITLNYSLAVRPISTDFAFDNSDMDIEFEEIGDGYLESSDKIESDHREIVSKAKKLTADLEDDLDKAEAIYSFVISHMEYDLNSPHRNKGALAALRNSSGVCEDYAALFVALCRASDIPARQVNGYTDPRGTGEIWDLDDGQALSLSGYRHSWAEFYMDDIGWVPADPTFDMHSRDDFKYFGSFSGSSHMVQNYLDQSIRGSFHGGQLAISWGEELVKH